MTLDSDLWFFYFVFSSRRRHTRCALVTGVQTCALPICLSFADIDFVNSKPALTRLGLAAQLKFFASLGFFAIDPGSIPTDGLSYLAEQLGVEAGEIAGYDFSSRIARRHCAEILIHLGYHRMKRVDRAQLTEWIEVGRASCRESVCQYV